MSYLNQEKTLLRGRQQKAFMHFFVSFNDSNWVSSDFNAILIMSVWRLTHTLFQEINSFETTYLTHFISSFMSFTYIQILKIRMFLVQMHIIDFIILKHSHFKQNAGCGGINCTKMIMTKMVTYLVYLDLDVGGIFWVWLTWHRGPLWSLTNAFAT